MLKIIIILFSLNIHAQMVNIPTTSGGGGAVNSVNGQIGAVVLTKSSIGLGSASNTSDVNKPVSTAQQTALDYKLDINWSKTVNPNGGTTGFSVVNKNIDLVPLAPSISESWNINQNYVTIDPTDTGFPISTSNNAITLHNLGFTADHKSSVGRLSIFNSYSLIGNGVDAIDLGGYSIFSGFGNIKSGVTLKNGYQGYGFQLAVDSGSSMDSSGFINPFYDFSTWSIPVNSYTSFAAAPTISAIKNNSGYIGLNIAPNITTLQGNAGFTGVNVSPTITNYGTGGFTGVNVNPTITSGGSVNLVYASTTNVTSTNKWAAWFEGDVNITGSLSFGGALSIGKLNAYGILNPVIDGGGVVSSVNSLISQITIPPNATTANADTIGTNTAMLLTVGTNSAITLGPIGIFSSLALPTVIETHTGSLLPAVQGGVFALSFGSGSTGGTVTEAIAARFLMIPNGITTVTTSIGVKIHNPFGNVGITNFGIYQTDAERNFFQGTVESEKGIQLKTSGGQPTCSVSTRGMFWNTEGGSGVADILEICQKNAANNYVWIVK